MMNYLETLSDKGLFRLYNRLLQRIHSAFDGDMFGIDLRTLGIISPGFYSAYVMVNAERIRRNS